jgi:queuine tRNA-ribosyltransferase
MPDHFEVLVTESGARRARLRTAHGVVETPMFMPVGTQGTVKAATPAQLKEAGAQIILSNTYHLNLRPGPELIRELGGLHKFMGWDGPILTDSGGFQVFSLAKLRKMTDDGVSFRSHLDGAEVFLGPRECMEIQTALGSDIAMVLDECPPWPAEAADVRAAVARTIRWAKACREQWHELGQPETGRHLFAIVQGSNVAELRRECAQALVAMDFPGYGIGGVSVGEPEPEMLAAVAASVPHLPENRPRYVMGVGTPPQLLKMIALGADMFDCVLPTRLARHGCAMTPDGPINLKNAKFARDARPLIVGHDNYTCRNFSRAYLRHLTMCNEMLGGTLLTLHNLQFYLDLMTQARKQIEAGNFLKWSQAWCARYEANLPEAEAMPVGE